MKTKFILLVLLITLGTLVKGNPSVYYQTTEQAKNPIGVDNISPRFSWKINSELRNTKQTAYQIIVSESDTDFNRSSIWNSGKIASEESILIPFEGRKLEPSKTYYWKVKVWDNKGNESDWGEVNNFTMGLLDVEDWNNAKWIALEKDKPIVGGIHGLVKSAIPEDKVGMFKMPQFRKEIQTKKKVSKALAYISGLGHFELFVNGDKVGNHFLDPGWTLYDKEALYVSFDVTDQLQQGSNVLGIMLGNGFYNIPQERYYKLLTSYGAPKAKLNLTITYEDGTTETIVTDESWKVKESPVFFSSIFAGEDYDATKEDAGWKLSGYNDKNWSDVILSSYDPKLISQQAEPLTIRETIPVVKKYKNEKGNWLYDLGQNFSGIVRLKVKANNGDTICLIPAELLNEDATANQSASGDPFYFNYIAKGDPLGEVWQPQFTYYGFRYIEVKDAVPLGEENPDNLPEIVELVGLHTCLSAPEVGTFECSNPMFNKIHDLIDWAMRSNMASVLTDCPHREKLGWLEEAYLMQYSLQYRYNLSRLYKKTMNDMRTSQTGNGVIPTIAPEYVRFEGGFEDTPEWGSAYIISPWHIYQWYGDKNLLTEHYPNMNIYMDYLSSRADDNIIAYGLGDWFDLGPNHPGYSQLTSNGVTATATYYHNATIMAKIAELLNKADDAKKYKQLAADIKESFNKHFFDPNTKTYDRNSQTANAIALFMGLVEDSNKEIIVNNLVKDITDRENALTAGDVGYRYVLRALEANDHSELIYDMNSKYDVPGYGWQLANGATALTESWQAYGFVSNNHFMLGHLMEWLYSGLGGIRQADNSVGYKTILISPQIVGDITSARSSHESPYGLIRSEWKNTDNEYTLKVSVPTNSEAVVCLPTTNADKVTEYGLALSKIDGLSVLGVENDMLNVKVGSGEYLFKVDK